jgi:predicted N-acetyltransferase YhbS
MERALSFSCAIREQAGTISFPFWRWALLRRAQNKIGIKVALMIKIVPLGAVDAAAVETLLDAAFGADRRERTAYKLRAGVDALPFLSFAAIEAEQLMGSVQSWPVALEAQDGSLWPMTLVGPVAVSPAVQRGGIGKLLMQAMLGAAEREGHTALIMIGDPEYYERFFGFSAAPTQKWELSGPFERHRLLARITSEGGVPAVGRVIPDPTFASQPINA